MTGDRSRYGTLEAAGLPAAGGRSLRAVAAAAALGVVALGLAALALGGAGAPAALVAVPPGDFTAARDRAQYAAWFSQLDAAAASSRARDSARRGGALRAAVGAGERRAAPAAARRGPQSTAASRKDMSDFFDSMPTHKRLAHSMSAATAEKQLDDIFPTQERALKRRQRAQDRHDASLAMSAQSASDDLDSYFDSMQTHAAHKTVQKDAWADQSSETRKYIESKRAAINSAGGKFTTIGADGKVRSVADEYSSAKAREDLDSFFGGEQNKKLAASHDAHQHKIAAESGAMHDARLVKEHPEFERVLVQAHAMWMALHKNPPTSKEDVDKYDQMVYSLSQKKPKTQTIIEEYISQHPEYIPKFKKLAADWKAKHAHPPQTEEEKKEYASLMLQDVGKLNINREEVEKKTAEMKKEYLQKHMKDAAKTAGGDKDLEAYYAAHPEIKKAVDKVHEVWIKEHGNAPPKNADEQAEYDGLMEKYVGKPSAKLAPTTQLDEQP